MEHHAGKLKLYMYVTDSNKGSDDVFKDRMRRVTLLTRYSVTREEAAEIATRFLVDNKLQNGCEYLTEAVWSYSTFLFQE